MEAVERHEYEPDVSFDGGNLDCGNGLLLLLRKEIDPLSAGQLLEILSTEISVEEDLPAWCRLTKNELVSFTKRGNQRSFLVSKGPFDPLARQVVEAKPPLKLASEVKAVVVPQSLPDPSPAKVVPPLSIMSIGSWPRPDWMLRALNEYLEGRLSRQEFDATADDAVKIAIQSQMQAGVDVITDGEQRRDNYASFVGSLLDNCQLVPIVDLLPLVDDPDKFESELQALDVPADKVRHPVVFGPLGRSTSLLLRDVAILKSQARDMPVKVALPGPYLLSRIMWLDCLKENAYKSRERLARDIVRVLREETCHLLADGVSIVQFDEPVLTEVAFASQTRQRTFMCGALSERKERDDELQFAKELINDLTQDLPRDRLAIHICRGNWTVDEDKALTGSYDPLLPLLNEINVGTLFLEFCTQRAGSLHILRELPSHMRVGVGVVNQKNPRVESVAEIVEKMREAIQMIGADRILLNPDCGFATFADSPIASDELAQSKLKQIALAKEQVL